MARLLKTRGSPGASRLLVAEFDGLVKDGATFRLRGPHVALRDGDLIAFKYPDELAAGITVSEDSEGLHSLVNFGSGAFLRIGLEALGERGYALQPAAHHIELWPELTSHGTGIKIH
jgi:hypothetical protein